MNQRESFEKWMKNISCVSGVNIPIPRRLNGKYKRNDIQASYDAFKAGWAAANAKNMETKK